MTPNNMHQIDTFNICGVPVPVLFEADVFQSTDSLPGGATVPDGGSLSDILAGLRKRHLSNHLLYRWEIFRASAISTVYIGKASGGNDRPMKTYPKVVADLRSSRGKRKLCQDPIAPYFPRNPWGFRWIHHELEAVTFRMANGNPGNESIRLILFALGISPNHLDQREREEIRRAKVTFAPDVVANDKPSMAAQRRGNLERAWIC